MSTFHRNYFIVGLAALCLLFPVAELVACACCSEPGDYVLRSDDSIEDHQLTQIQGMRFGPAAQLYLTEAGEEEDARGISNVSDHYKLAVTMEGGRWRMTFRSMNGKTGTLTLPFPSAMTVYAADIHDGKKSAGNGPLLYKEWRFEGAPDGDGIFQEGLAESARFTFVFQGRGNRCDNASDFTHWRLSISGNNAHYVFFGGLVK